MTMLHVLVVATAFGSATGQMCLPTQDASELLKQRGLSMDGKVVVLTGASSGIGLGIATAVASAGAKVIILGYHKDSAAAAAANITKTTGNKDVSVIAPFDLSSFQSVKDTATAVLKMAPKIDVLVCDAGLNSEFAGLPNVTADGFEITFQITFLGHFLLTETLLPALRAAKGRVVNTGSISNGFHNLSSSVTVYEDETLCAWQSLPGDCSSVAAVQDVLRKPAPVLPFGLGQGFTFLSLYFKTFYSYEFSDREGANGVSMYSGHPGVVETAQNGNFNNKSVVIAQCEPMGWMGCNCVSDESLEFDVNICPLSIYDGSGGLAWLAAAPKTTIEASPARFFTLCVPAVAPANQYDSYVLSRGADEARAYALSLTSLWRQWVAKYLD
eukprot:m.245163 g.245163  ORF g.245163 m.245163 type:complete len:385 (+) comp15849_c0_seq13:35-1189(+)